MSLCWLSLSPASTPISRPSRPCYPRRTDAPERNGTCPSNTGATALERACHERPPLTNEKSSVVSLKASGRLIAHAAYWRPSSAAPGPKTPCTKGMAPDPARLPSICEICCRLQIFSGRYLYRNGACAEASTQPLSLIYSLAPLVGRDAVRSASDHLAAGAPSGEVGIRRHHVGGKADPRQEANGEPSIVNFPPAKPMAR